jgi:hypothetical protein
MGNGRRSGVAIAWLLSAAFAACLGEEPNRPEAGTSEAGVDAAEIEIGDGGSSGDASDGESGDASDRLDAKPALPRPHSDCMMADTTTTGYAIATSPDPATTSAPLEVVVTGPSPGATNVTLAVCSPHSAELQIYAPVKTEGFPVPTWTFDVSPRPYGFTQLGLRADPAGSTLYQTVLVAVEQ